MNILAALLIFTVIVVVHEFGHFLLAKKNGVEVTEFSVGMGPRLVTAAKTKDGIKCKLFCSQKTFDSREDWQGITKYSWKLFPIGGSCAMVGEDMEDDSEGSFNSKGVWARFSIIFAGPFFNFLLAFVFSVIILGVAGVDLPRVTEVYSGQPGEAAGIKTGDLIKRIDGKKISIGRELTTHFQFHPMTGKDIQIVVERDGEEKTLMLSPDYTTYLFGFTYSANALNTKISEISQDSAFAKAGIREGDSIVSVNGTAVHTGEELGHIMEQEKASGQPVDFVIQRDGQEKSYTVAPVKYEGRGLGIAALEKTKMGPLQILKYSAIEVRFWIVSVLGSLGQLISGQLTTNDISGPVGIVDMVGGVIDESASQGALPVFINMLYMSVLLSANLGVMNLLPLPALDGGRLVFILIEGIRGKAIDREKEGFVHLIGFFLLMALMVFVMYNDIIKIVR